jgi:hypothetical protein
MKSDLIQTFVLEQVKSDLIQTFVLAIFCCLFGLMLGYMIWR